MLAKGIIVIVALLILVGMGYGAYHIYCGQYWKGRKLDNFPFIHKGRMLWYSRAVATTLFVFAKDKEGVLHVLANKRGQGAADFQGYWNAPCGYLQFDVTGEENAQAEVWEETGLFVPLNQINFWKVVSSPTQNKQNIALKYYAMLSGICESYTFSTENMEDREVEEIAWVPVTELGKLEWAFGHKYDIIELMRDVIKN